MTKCAQNLLLQFCKICLVSMAVKETLWFVISECLKGKEKVMLNFVHLTCVSYHNATWLKDLHLRQTRIFATMRFLMVVCFLWHSIIVDKIKLIKTASNRKQYHMQYKGAALFRCIYKFRVLIKNQDTWIIECKTMIKFIKV